MTVTVLLNRKLLFWKLVRYWDWGRESSEMSQGFARSPLHVSLNSLVINYINVPGYFWFVFVVDTEYCLKLWFILPRLLVIPIVHVLWFHIQPSKILRVLTLCSIVSQTTTVKAQVLPTSFIHELTNIIVPKTSSTHKSIPREIPTV